MKVAVVMPVTAAELREWRRQLRWTQQQAAAWLRVQQASYENWEQGRRSPSNPGPLRSRMQQAKRRVG